MTIFLFSVFLKISTARITFLYDHNHVLLKHSDEILKLFFGLGILHWSRLGIWMLEEGKPSAKCHKCVDILKVSDEDIGC